MDKDDPVVAFLAEQLQRREDERRRFDDRLALTHRANLGFLLVTWRFILLSRAAFFALEAAALQYVLQNIAVFLDTSRIVTVFETYFGLSTAVITAVRLMTSAQAGNLVAIIILTIVAVTFVLDVMLSRLERRCAVRGLEAERYLNVEALFFEISTRRTLIEAPFQMARYATLVFGIIALWYLVLAR